MSNRAETADPKPEPTRGRTPKLRFPEFQDALEWEEKEVGEVFRVTRGNVLSMTLVQDVKTDKTPYPVYSSQTKNNGLSGFYSEYLYEDAITWTTDGANAGDVNYRSGKFYCTNVCGVLINTKGYANPCVAALINNVSRKYVSYVGNPKLMNGVMSKIVISLPTVLEQQKIADCLSSLEYLITTQSQKLEALELHKKGLMQQLFPVEGESVPRLRFLEFRDSLEWEEKKLGQISSIRTGPFGSVLHESDYVEVGTPIITVEHLSDLGIKGKNFPRVSDDDKIRLTSYKLKEGDIVFSRVGSVDRSSIIRVSEDGWLFSGRLLRLRIIKLTENSPQFLNQLLKYEPSKTKIRDRAVGQTMPSLNTEILNSIPFYFPSLLEQQKIADCLSSLDELITAQKRKLEGLKIHKKGLMQGLFPSPDPVQE